ncbi:CAI-1 autoinducer sensor kinase/phosphatase CqsS [Elysia marginata]|uniref:CAI-1 autoinducer sensor kinase/phosphatase CqsS n=1 Tax=Elysia marginata TaxID=1093978 RepID=A0AAV4HI40_9GAST|nr:CAI-1 autoinducer sensor kinase/phosphatase CqsS [Elysia marginata]
MINDYSRFPEVEILYSTSAKVVIPKINQIFARFGSPIVLKSDNGPPFNGTEFAAFAKKLGFHHHRPTNVEPTPGPSDITQPLPDLPSNVEPTPGPSYAISALVNTPLTNKRRLRTVEERNERDAALHPVKDGCTASCKLECNKTFGCEDGKRINKEFWSLSPEERRQWIWTIVLQESKKRTTTKAGSRRSVTNQYFLRRSFESGGVLKCVCKVFFLTTLGYSKSSDAAVMRILKSTSIENTRPNPDQRGRHEPKNKIDRSEILEHIKKYNPAVHHCRRTHAPNRLYLPSDITSSDMHAVFFQSIRQIGIETYRKEIRAQNISFAILGAEECEICKR